MTEKQRRFVEAYMGDAAGNATEAARRAGYSGDDNTLAVTGARTLRNAKVAAALTERQEADPAVATRAERQAFWSDVMRGTDPHGQTTPTMGERLKASELLGRTGGDFVDRQEGALTIRVLRG